MMVRKMDQQELADGHRKRPLETHLADVAKAEAAKADIRRGRAYSRSRNPSGDQPTQGEN